ncbi:hypothetical protein [Enterococcus sp. AZ163]|uniref:hypothetical protein n=1 Tax=Enterococcus sp. AZ163 TaxID=2774638 RepID=UPI003D290E19
MQNLIEDFNRNGRHIEINTIDQISNGYEDLVKRGIYPKYIYTFLLISDDGNPLDAISVNDFSENSIQDVRTSFRKAIEKFS